MSFVGRIGSPSHSRSRAAPVRMNLSANSDLDKAVQQALTAKTSERELMLDT